MHSHKHTETSKFGCFPDPSSKEDFNYLLNRNAFFYPCDSWEGDSLDEGDSLILSFQLVGGQKVTGGDMFSVEAHRSSKY